MHTEGFAVMEDRLTTNIINNFVFDVLYHTCTTLFFSGFLTWLKMDLRSCTLKKNSGSIPPDLIWSPPPPPLFGMDRRP
jgi:hypothetical protein